MNTDPIADLLTRIRNAVQAGQEKTIVPYSYLKKAILEVLKKQHFVSDYKIVKNGPFNEIEILFSPDHRQLSLKRVSRPGQRIYIKNADIKSVVSGYGIAILSTSKGVLSGKEAKKLGLGGEYICEVW